MYTKRVQVRRGDKTYVYVKLVESFREGGRVRQRVVANLGREDELKASGQLESLAGAFARLDPPMLGRRREVGPLLVIRHVLERLGLSSIIEEHLPQHRRSVLSPAEVVVALVCNRLASPSPLYDVSGWASGSALQELFGIPPMLLNDDRLGRVLDDFAPVAEKVRSAVMLRAIEDFGVDASRLHLDLTTLRVAGAYEGSSLVTKGWGPDRRVARQVRTLTMTNREGVPLYVRPEPGNAAELSCLHEAFEHLAEMLPKGLVVCADSAMGHIESCARAEEAGLFFVVPLREATGFRTRYLNEVGRKALSPLSYVSRSEAELPPKRRTRYEGTLRDFVVTDDSGKRRTWRVAYIWSSEEEASVQQARARALERAEAALRKMQNGLGGRYYRTKDQVDTKLAQILPPVAGLIEVTTGEEQGKPTISFSRNEAAISSAGAADGLYALATNLPGRRLTAGQVLETYKDQSLVELAHRNAKQQRMLRVRPIFLHNDDRIAALVSVVGLALVVFCLIEIKVRQSIGDEMGIKGLLPENRAARPTGRNILAAFQGLGITYTPEGILLDRLTGTQRMLLDLLKVELPWSEQQR
jgi:transposase